MSILKLRQALCHLFLIFSFNCFSQSPYYILDSLGTTTKIELKCKNSECLKKKITRHQLQLASHGFIQSNLSQKDTLYYLFANKQFTITSIHPGNIPKQIYNEHWRTLNLSGFNPSQIQKAMHKTLEYYENRGYPFASLSFKNIQIKAQEVEVSLELKKNKEVRIDSIILKGNVRLSESYLYKHIDVYPGNLYNQSKLDRVEQHINNLSFARSVSAPYVEFTHSLSKLIIPIKKQKTSSFRGILGVQPSENQKTTITGEADLMLHNNFSKGERFHLLWKSPSSFSQNLDLSFSYPYIFNTSFGVETALSFFRKDTTFSNFDAKAAVLFLKSTHHYYSFFVKHTQSNVLATSDEQLFLGTQKLAYGLSYTHKKYDNFTNPYKGFSLFISADGARKQLLSDQSDSAKVNHLSTQVHVRYFVPIAKKMTLSLLAEDRRMFSDALFENEFYRLGGFSSLRGYNEQSIFASSFSRFSFEPRFLLDEFSALYAFADLFYFENANTQYQGLPLGFGLGFQMMMGPGLFSFSYALSKNQYFEADQLISEPISLRSGKVHFGFISYF